MPVINTEFSKEFYYRKSGSGPAFVLVHGFPASGSLWYPVADELAENFTVIVPDLPGSGLSSLDDTTELDQMATCIKDVLNHEQIEKAVIAGHSMGGYVAFAFAAMYPEHTAGLSLVHSTPVTDDDARIQMRRKAIELFKNGGKNAFIRQMIPTLFAPIFKLNRSHLVEKQILESLQLSDNALVNFYNAMIERKDYSQWLINCSIPVQWLIGLEDNVISYKKLLQHCHKSNINFVTFYPECGHMSMLEESEKLKDDLTHFTDVCFLK